MQSIGFKEWALVCAALGEGRQTVIIRKGGIAEGRAGFAFQHREFFLFPTFFHEQLERVRTTEPVLPEPVPNVIEISCFARVEEAQERPVLRNSDREAGPWEPPRRAPRRERRVFQRTWRDAGAAQETRY